MAQENDNFWILYYEFFEKNEASSLQLIQHLPHIPSFGHEEGAVVPVHLPSKA